MAKNSKKRAKKRLRQANAQELTVVLMQEEEPSPAPPTRWLVWLGRRAIRPFLMLLARRMQQAGSALASALMPWASSLAPLHGGSVALPSPTGSLLGGCDGSQGLPSPTVPLHGEDSGSEALASPTVPLHGGSEALSSTTVPLHGKDNGSVALSSPAPPHLRAEPSAVQQGSSAELPGDALQEEASQECLQQDKEAGQEEQDAAVAPEVEQAVLSDIDEEYEHKEEEKGDEKEDGKDESEVEQVVLSDMDEEYEHEEEKGDEKEDDKDDSEDHKAASTVCLDHDMHEKLLHEGFRVLMDKRNGIPCLDYYLRNVVRKSPQKVPVFSESKIERHHSRFHSKDSTKCNQRGCHVRASNKGDIGKHQLYCHP